MSCFIAKESYDPETGTDGDEYEEALKWGIDKIIDNIHFIKGRDDDVIDAVYYNLFNQEMMESYQEYVEEQRL